MRKSEPMLTSGFCALVALAALAVAVRTVAAGQIGEQGLDALFVILVSLLVAAAFSVPPVVAWRKGLLRRSSPQPAATQSQAASQQK